MPYSKEPHFLDLFDVRRLGERARHGIDASVQLGFLLLVVLMVVGSWLSFRHTRLLFESQKFVAHTHEVISSLRSAYSSLKEAESAARAFALTGRDSALEPYRASLPLLEEELTRLRELTADNPAQRELVPQLVQLVEERKQEFRSVIEAGHNAGLDSAADIVEANMRPRFLDRAYELVKKLEKNEEDNLLRRTSDARSSYTTAQATGIAVGFVGAVLVLAVYYTVRRYSRLQSTATRLLAGARERFEVALGSVGDAVLVTDTEGRLAYCNRGCGPVLGIGFEDIGKPLMELVQPAGPSSQVGKDDFIARVLASAGTFNAGPNAELRLRDGSLIPVDLTAARLPDETGRPQGVVLVVMDVSERREHELELERSNERFRSLVLVTSQIVWTMDAEGTVREDSPSWRSYTGQTYEQWQGQGWIEALHPDDRERVQRDWRAAVAAKRPFSIEYRLRGHDGVHRWNMVRAVPVLDFDGTLREWVGMNHDIQARKLAEKAEHDAHRRKDEFIALLAHELRNPLAPIRNGLEILKSGSKGETDRAITLMDRQVRHMVRLIDDLLDLGRIAQGKLELRLERVDVRDVLRQALDSMQPAIDAKGQHASLRVPDAPLWVDGDAVRLHQIVTNLLNNAVKYSPEGASIWLQAEREGPYCLMSVRDTGRGIDPELQPHVWELFRQGDRYSHRHDGGLGIGLTLVKSVAELHGGSVEVLSAGVGTGSEFRVRIPVVSGRTRTDAARRSRPVPATPARPLTILVVDDNEDSAVSLAMLLRLGGHHVEVAFRGGDGIEKTLTLRPDVVLCDIRMPDMSGFEVARRIRGSPDGATCTLVALTGFGAAHDRESTTKAGFDQHLVKPVDPEDLRRLLEVVSHGKQASTRSTDS